MVECVQMFVVIQVPQQSLGVFAARRAQRTVRRNGNGIQVTIVSLVVNLELAIGQIPDLDGTIPARWNNQRIAVVRRETDARNPIGMTFILNGVLAFGQSVPQLDGFVTRSGHDLTVVNGECNRKNVLHLEETHFSISFE